MRKEKPNCDYSQKWKKTNKLTFFKKRSCQENIWNIQSWDFCTIKINTNSHPHTHTHSLTLVVIVCVSLRASCPLVPRIAIVWSFLLRHPHSHLSSSRTLILDCSRESEILSRERRLAFPYLRCGAFALFSLFRRRSTARESEKLP